MRADLNATPEDRRREVHLPNVKLWLTGPYSFAAESGAPSHGPTIAQIAVCG